MLLESQLLWDTLNYSSCRYILARHPSAQHHRITQPLCGAPPRQQYCGHLWRYAQGSVMYSVESAGNLQGIRREYTGNPWPLAPGAVPRRCTAELRRGNARGCVRRAMVRVRGRVCVCVCVQTMPRGMRADNAEGRMPEGSEWAEFAVSRGCASCGRAVGRVATRGSPGNSRGVSCGGAVGRCGRRAGGCTGRRACRDPRARLLALGTLRCGWPLRGRLGGVRVTAPSGQKAAESRRAGWCHCGWAGRGGVPLGFAEGA